MSNNTFKFKDYNLTDVEDISTPQDIDTDQHSELLNDIVNNLVFYIETSDSDKSITELMDEYFSTPKGKLDYAVLDDTALKFGTVYHQARDVLVNTVAQEVQKLSDQISALHTSYMNAYGGYKDINGKYVDHIKFDLLDIDHLESKYKSTVEDIAKVLCSKFNFNVDVLNINNIKSLLKAVSSTTNINLNESTKQDLLKEVIITIRTDDETEANSEITVNGESAIDDPDTTVNDDTSVSEDTDENTEVDATVNDDTGNSNININVNGKPVTEVNDQEDEEIQKDKELLYEHVAKALYSKSGFENLRTGFTTTGGYTYTSKQLQRALWFANIDINNIVSKISTTKLQHSERYGVLNNAKSVLDLQKGVVVYLDLMMREMKDDLIITPRMLNKSAVTHAQNKGIDIYTWVKDYLRVNHNKNTYDCIYNKCNHTDMVMGVDLNKLAGTRSLVEDKIRTATESVHGNHKDAYKHHLKQAYTIVMSNYITDICNMHVDAIPENMSKEQFKYSAIANINSLAENMVKNDLSNIEDYVYTFYFMYWQKNTLVERIYNEMSYHLQSDIQSMHGEDTQKLVHAKVMSSIIVDMLKKHM